MQTNYQQVSIKESSKISQTLKSDKISLKETFMGACTNFVYKIGAIGGLKRMPYLLKRVSESEKIVILGECFRDKEQAKKRVSSIIWFTYREKLKITEDLNSDVGWGCLPRVGQMVLAQSLHRFFVERGEVQNSQLLQQIIETFIDDNESSSNYSLSTILKYARWKFGINPGQWFNIGQISQVLRKLQDETAMKGSENLKIIFFSQSVIFVDKIYEKAEVQSCRCSIKKRICPVCHSHLLKNKQLVGLRKSNSIEIQIIDENSVNSVENKQKQYVRSHSQQRQPSSEFVHQLNKHILLIISARVSEKEIDPLQYQSILSLLSLPSSNGIIGGVPTKALYIVGHYNKQVIYLDPHFVQLYVDKNSFKQSFHTFFSSQFRTLNREALDPSMAFCFYLKTLEDIEELILKIEELKTFSEKQNKNFYLSVMDANSEEEVKREKNCLIESPEGYLSYEYNSLEFQDICDNI